MAKNNDSQRSIVAVQTEVSEKDSIEEKINTEEDDNKPNKNKMKISIKGKKLVQPKKLNINIEMMNF